MALLLAFVASRSLLVVTSYDTVSNWEEPVFLYSAQAIRSDGIATIFDHQDDLSHGGSIPLLLAAGPWTALLGPRLDVLKGVAILWSAATLIAALLVGCRFVSPSYGLLLGLMLAGVSASAATLQVTLVGSHPESILFCVLALGAYWRTLEQDADARASFALGVASGAAVWCSYLAAPWIVPLLAFHLLRRPRRIGVTGAGVLLGASPWIVQHVFLRPYGAMQWIERLAYHRTTSRASWSPSYALGHLVDSFGIGGVGGAVLLVMLIMMGAYAIVRAFHRESSLANASRPATAAVLPLAVGVALGFATLAAGGLHAVPREGLYYHRFYMPLQATLYCLAAFGVEAVPLRIRSKAFAAVSIAVIALWILGQAPLYAGGNQYVPDEQRDLLYGCGVFGHAEIDRAESDESAVARLAKIEPRVCRRAAFRGFGVGALSRYARDGDVHALTDALATVDDTNLREAACAGARELAGTMYEEAMTTDRRTTGVLYLELACRPAPPATGTSTQ